MADRPEEVRILVRTPPEYRPVYVTNVWGGPTPAGKLEMHFFLERRALPREIVHAVGPTGGLGPELRRDVGSGTFVRDVACGIIMSLRDAKALSNWLQETIRKMEEVQAAGGPPQPVIQ